MLMDAKGAYYGLVQAQNIRSNKQADDPLEDEEEDLNGMQSRWNWPLDRFGAHLFAGNNVTGRINSVQFLL